MAGTIEELSRTIASGEAMLFTGAGFSSEARDVDGNPLPDSRQMIAELWPICFRDEDPDDSSLADLYDVALVHARDRLRDYVGRRLRVGDAKLPPYLATWLGAPWKRIYTLNVDDLELAVQRQYALPHRLRSISAIAPERSRADTDGALEVVHLNGMAGDDPAELTFSTMQYAARLCARDREYERLAADLAGSPFVFVGTTLDEVILWQHLELQRRRGGGAFDRPPSFLIARSLTRARQVLLESLQIQWQQSSVADVANQILGGSHRSHGATGRS
jgi:hypothetical protein